MSKLQRSAFTLFLSSIFLITSSSSNVVLPRGNTVIYSPGIIKLSNRHPRYVGRLENRLEKLEGLLNKVHLTPRPPPLLPQFRPDQRGLKDLGASALDITSSLQVLSPASNITTSITRNTTDHKFTSLDLNANGDTAAPDETLDEVDKGFSNLAIDTAKPRFIGKSSSANLVNVAFQVKSAYTGIGSDAVNLRRQEFWSVHPVSYLSPVPSSLPLNPLKQWEVIPKQPPKTRYTFPPPELFNSLIHHYFSTVNVFLPLLHRPTFERSIAMHLHHTDDDFAVNVLLVCALGARYSNDDRVKLDGIDDWRSSGWRWYNQVEAHRRSYHNVGLPTLYDLQFYCVCFSTLRLSLLILTCVQLAVLFLEGSSTPHACWTMIGIGIRLAQDAGAHRRKPNTKMMVEDEMWKRTFW